jgi:3-isopropylmalate dehydrogenase
MKKFKIAVLTGDGIGPEVVGEAVKILNGVAKKFKLAFSYDYQLIGAAAIHQTGDALPKATLEACKKADAVLLGAIGDPSFDNDPSAKVRPEQGLLALRKGLNLFANIRPLKAYKDLLHMSPLKEEIIKGSDILIYRELTGGIYFGEKGYKEDGKVAYDHCEYSEEEIERITHQAFKAAEKRRKKLTLVDKANVLETSRLWRKVVQRIAKEYPTVQMETLFVDNAAMQLVLNPSQFDVVLTENMFGDIISDEASIIAGSLGLLPSASLGTETAMFEPVHGSYPQAAGKGIANPVATILSVAMMLQHLGLTKEAEAVEDAVEYAIHEGISTLDIAQGKSFNTEEVGDFILQYIEEDDFKGMNYFNVSVGSSTII